MRVPPWVVCVFFPGVFLSSGVTGAIPVTTDLVMRVNVRTTTTTVPKRCVHVTFSTGHGAQNVKRMNLGFKSKLMRSLFARIRYAVES